MKLTMGAEVWRAWFQWDETELQVAGGRVTTDGDIMAGVTLDGHGEVKARRHKIEGNYEPTKRAALEACKRRLQGDLHDAQVAVMLAKQRIHIVERALMEEDKK